ncbi:MAG: hypothetical protein ACI8RZ_006712 [Myxococcota bacterium]|jgi:hypothetical protein
MRPGSVMLLILLLSGCSDYKLGDQIETIIPAPELVLSTDHLDFGAQADGVEVSQVLWVENIGTAVMSVMNISLEGSPAFTLSQPEELVDLPPDSRQAVVLHYAPINFNEEATLRIFTNDPRQPSASVQLTGTGAYPELSLSANPLVLSIASPGESSEEILTVTNSGSVALVIDSLILTGEAFECGETFTLPIRLKPEDSLQVPVTFSSNFSGTFSGQIWFEDNTVSGLSSGGLLGASAVPVAVCSTSSPTLSPIHESTDWLGDESFDAAGGALTEYHWTLVDRPEGSVVSLGESQGSANRYNFTPDLAGEYTAQLVVINEDGVTSEPCTTTIDAVPDQNFWIEMFWTHPDDDMDLHLLSPGGERGSDGDCFYDNCVNGELDWGELGNSIDDPSLDIDDIHGTGPENINIPIPEDGTFTILVHDYQFSTPNYYGANSVTVNVYLGGQLAWSGSRSISGENTYTRFVKVTWPEGAIIEL